MKSFGPRKKLNCMHGLKSTIWIGHALLFSTALQNGSQYFFFLFYTLIFIYFFKYENIVRSSSASSFGHSDPDSSSVKSLFLSNLDLRRLHN